MTQPRTSRVRLGEVLVALQFVLLGLLAALGVAGLRAATPPWDAAVAAIGAVALGAWALAANRPGNFNIRPTPREGGRLIAHGPYRWIRHPMYSALLLAGVAAARVADDEWAWVTFVALALVLAIKASVEERWMIEQHPAYAEYQRRTRRFVPGIL